MDLYKAAIDLLNAPLTQSALDEFGKQFRGVDRGVYVACRLHLIEGKVVMVYRKSYPCCRCRKTHTEIVRVPTFLRGVYTMKGYCMDCLRPHGLEVLVPVGWHHTGPFALMGVVSDLLNHNSPLGGPYEFDYVYVLQELFPLEIAYALVKYAAV